MAIVEMSKLSVICLNSQKRRFIKELMDLGVVEITKPTGYSSENPMPEGTFITNNSAEVSGFEAQIAALGTALDILNAYDESKKPLFATRREVSAEEFAKAIESDKDIVKSIAEESTMLSKKTAENKAEINRLSLLIRGLEPWKGFDLPLNNTGTKTSAVFTGCVPIKTNLEEMLTTVLEEVPSAVMQNVSADKNQTYLCFICLKEEKSRILEVLRRFSFSTITLNDNKGTADEAISEYNEKINTLNGIISDDELRLKELARSKDKLEMAYDDLLIKRDRAKAVGDMLNTKKVFTFNGWIPVSSSNKVKELLDSYGCYYEISEPIKSEETPILLKNNRWVRPFEAITEMYSMPLATELDPTPVMAIFYFVLFGMMLSDAAYGIILSIACFVILKKFKLEGFLKKMVEMFFWCGISTFVWGAVFGGWFGDVISVASRTFLGKELTIPPLWLDPLEDPMTVLIFSLGLGLIHIFTGMGMQAYMLIKEGKAFDAFCDIILWYILIIGLLAFGFGGSIAPIVATVGKWAAIFGAVGILITGGRKKKGLGKIIGGLGSLYGITSYLSDTLSYSRLLALGLATGVIAKVVNVLGTLKGPGVSGLVIFVCIFLFGTVFNLAINVLGTYVHACRLQYVEFFGKFFTGGGRPFAPFAENTKFVKIINKEEN